MKLSFGPRLWAFTTLLILSCSMAFSQATTSLRGNIKDPSGASIPDAIVTIALPSQGFTRKGVSDSSGVYQFQQIPPGVYTVKVEKDGFNAVVQNNVQLQVNSPATLEIKLEVGNVSQTIAVEASAPAINTQDASIGNAFNTTQVRQLPLLTRNVVELLNLQPGVTQAGQVLGARADQNNVTLDGADVNDNQQAGAFTAVLPVPLDSVQEFRVTVGGQGADQGRSSGGQVSLVTKSGSNRFSGSLYEFHRNTVTSANNWFSNRAGTKRENLIRNQYGASFGGPIKKDRLFFFFNYEARRDASASNVTRTVPTEAFKNGIFTIRTSDGATRTLTANEVASNIDPNRIGMNAYVKTLLSRYPTGNDATLGSDAGLNFTGLRFNAPVGRDDKAYVAKMDYNIDSQGMHKVFFRGTLADNSRDNTSGLAQFPGQAAVSKILDNSRGFTANYLGVLRPTMTNNLSVSLTRQGLAQSGATGTGLALSGISDAQNYSTRASGRILPTWQIVDDFTWTKGKHNIKTGMNFRFVRNNRFSYDRSFPSLGMSRGTMLGLGSDITTAMTNYIRTRDGLPSTVTVSNINAVQNAMGMYLGMITNVGLTYQFDKTGKAIELGAPQVRRFATNEYEFYVQDNWRISRDFNITAGVRYSNSSVPYETNGNQVYTSVGLDRYFADRNFLGNLGVPSFAIPSAILKYQLAGPANGAPSWYNRDKNNFAPRFSMAYSPSSPKGILKSIFGNGGVFRAGANMVYDRFGSQLITNFDSLGSVGLSSPATFPTSYNMTTAPRVNSAGSIASIPAPPVGGFPYVPPEVNAVAGTLLGINSDIKTPYSFILNASFARELPWGNSIEIGYAGRLGRKLLLQGDIFTPLTNFRDVRSNTTFKQASAVARTLYNNGLTTDAVTANPSLMPTIPFFENMFPSLKDFRFPGSATANYYNILFNEQGTSDLDALHYLDRTKKADGTCFSGPGCFTFFAPQGSAMPTWMNAGISNYHGMVLSIRRPLKKGISYDFNYTWSKSIDNGSAAEADAGQFGGVLQSVFYPGANRGASDFDIRHNINANTVVELPFGKGKKWLDGSNKVVNQFIGGWSLTAIVRYRSGLPFSVSGSGIWNTNYWIGGRAIPTSTVPNSIGLNEKGNPSLTPKTTNYTMFSDQFAGDTGTRVVFRGDSLVNWDMALGKRFFLPWEGHSLQFRAEAFNAFNQHAFSSPSLSTATPATFGQFSVASDPRVFQFGLRYDF